MRISRIMVPIDYSEFSKRALALAAELAQRFGASLDIVHVWDRPSYLTDAVMVQRPGEVVDRRRLTWAATAALVVMAWVWLGFFSLRYFTTIQLTGGISHQAFRTAKVEPKLAAWQQIARERKWFLISALAIVAAALAYYFWKF